MTREDQDDCVSRQAAIEAICTEGTRLERNGTVAMCEIKQWCVDILDALPSAQPEQTKMIKEIRKWINSGNRGSADYFIVDKIEEIINKYE